MKYRFILIILFSISFIQYSKQSFQDSLFTKIIEKNESLNIIISPLGIYQLLSILSNGVEGNTQKEILQILFSYQKIDDNGELILNNINNNLFEILTNISNEETFNLKEKEYEKNLKKSNISNYFFEPSCIKILNSLFFSMKYKVSNEFSAFCKKYNTSIIEFKNTKEINDLFYDKTNRKIKDILNTKKSDTEFILINAIYFQGTWYKSFNKEKTKKLPFLNINNDLVEVDTMSNFFKDIMYYKDEKVEMISLPYIAKMLKFKMLIILPNQNKYLSPLNYLKIESINIKDLIPKLKLTKLVNLFLPKFSYEFGISLNQVLKDMNMKKVFSKEADFSKIFNNNSIKIDDIIHKTFIKIDEEGSDAADANNIIDTYISDNNYQNPIYMYVNHSFIFTIICDKIKDSQGNYLIPFIGVVNNLEGNMLNKNKKNNFNNNNKNIRLNLNFEKAYIRFNYKGNLTKISASVNLRLNNTNNSIISSSSNNESKIKYNKINKILFTIIFMIISI